jgi:acyl-CoA synthetase (AMP-forming)/AMP-acid ligase II
VPIYDTLGDSTLQYVIGHAELPIIFAEPKKLAEVAKVLPECPTIKHVVQLVPGEVPGGTSAFETANVTIHAFDDLTQRGSAAPVEPKPSRKDDLAFIMYTSGTTGALSPAPSLGPSHALSCTRDLAHATSDAPVVCPQAIRKVSSSSSAASRWRRASRRASSCSPLTSTSRTYRSRTSSRPSSNTPSCLWAVRSATTKATSHGQTQCTILPLHSVPSSH